MILDMMCILEVLKISPYVYMIIVIRKLIQINEFSLNVTFAKTFLLCKNFITVFFMIDIMDMLCILNFIPMTYMYRHARIAS